MDVASTSSTRMTRCRRWTTCVDALDGPILYSCGRSSSVVAPWRAPEAVRLDRELEWIWVSLVMGV